MGSLLVWLAVIGLAFVGFGLLAGSSMGMERRSRFWARVLLVYLATLLLVLLVAGAIALGVLPERVLMLLWLEVVMMSLAFGPIFCYLSARSSPGSSDADGGGGSGPDQPPLWPTGPNGGIPLPDADQATARARDHNRPRLRGVKPRRRAREPERTPTPTNR